MGFTSLDKLERKLEFKVVSIQSLLMTGGWIRKPILEVGWRIVERTLA